MWHLRASLLFGLLACRICIVLISAIFSLIYRTRIEDGDQKIQRAIDTQVG
jgi:hypothetical protein